MKVLMKRVVTLVLALAVVLGCAQGVQVCSAAYSQYGSKNQQITADYSVSMGGTVIEVEGITVAIAHFGKDSYGQAVPVQVYSYMANYGNATSFHVKMSSTTIGSTGTMYTNWYCFNNYYYVKGTATFSYSFVSGEGSSSYTQVNNMYVSTLKDSLPDWNQG